MKALILAGGFGSRLQSVVSDVPKPMASVAGRPFLEHLLDHCLKFGYNEVLLSVGYKAELIIRHFGESYKGINLSYAIEKEALGQDDQEAFERTGLCDRNERHQVHAFILRLIQQRPDPSVIVLHAAQALEVVQHPADHARHRRNRFQHDGAVAVALAKEEVRKKSQEAGQRACDPV